jgi:hypothetical protein
MNRHMYIDIVDYNGYGYYCDPSNGDHEFIRPRINDRTYYTYNNPSNTIQEDCDYNIEPPYTEHMYTTKSNQVFSDKINSYKGYLLYCGIIVTTFTLTSFLVHYQII